MPFQSVRLCMLYLDMHEFTVNCLNTKTAKFHKLSF